MYKSAYYRPLGGSGESRSILGEEQWFNRAWLKTGPCLSAAFYRAVNDVHPVETTTSSHLMATNEGFTSWDRSYSLLMLLCQHGQKVLKIVSNTLLSRCHKEGRQWQVVAPSTSKENLKGEFNKCKILFEDIKAAILNFQKQIIFKKKKVPVP